jgi:hypothetical protein
MITQIKSLKDVPEVPQNLHILKWENINVAHEEYHQAPIEEVLHPDLYVSHQAPLEEVVSYTRRDNLLESEAYDKKK